MAITRCYQIHGGSCKNLVSVKGGYICSAGHGSKKANFSSPIAPLDGLDSSISLIDELSVDEKRTLAKESSSLELLEKLARDGDKDVRQRVAQNPSASPETLEILAGDENWGVRRGVAQNPSASPETLEILAGDENWGVRRGVAQNPSAPSKALGRLARDSNLDVRYWVARNPSASLEILEKLAGDRNWSVRRGVAENPSASLEILGRLAGDRNWGVRRGVAENSSVSRETYIKLAKEGITPMGFTKEKEVGYLLREENFSLLDEYPSAFGKAYLERLVSSPLPEDRSHPKTRLLIGYGFVKFAEASNDQYLISEYREKIQSLYPDDQELAEMVGY
jgi:hypothetical protein